MLETVIADRSAQSVSALARIARIPVATAHRQVDPGGEIPLSSLRATVQAIEVACSVI